MCDSLAFSGTIKGPFWPQAVNNKAPATSTKGFKYRGMIKTYTFCKNKPTIVAFICTKVTVVALFTSLFSSFNAMADIAVRNVNPLTQGTGLAPLFSAQPLAAKQQQLRFSIFGNSHFIAEEKEADALIFDAESWQFDVDYTIGFEHLALRINIPWVHYSGGRLDGLVDGFHKSFNLPEGNRSSVKRNQVFLAFKQEGQQTALTQTQHGFADMRISLGFALANNASNQHAFWLHGKLPSGKNSAWFSSGAADLGAYFTHQFQQGAWQQQLQYGMLLVGKGKFLRQRRRRAIGQLQASIGLQASKNWLLLAQVDANTAVYQRTHQQALVEGLLVSLGGVFSHNNWRLSLAITEDLLPESAPDVGFLFRISQNFN